MAPSTLKVIYRSSVAPADLPPGTIAAVNLIAVKVIDIKSHATELIDVLKNTSWITNLDAVGKATYESTAERTIQKLVADFSTVSTEVTSSFGQYMISMAAGQSLGLLLNHTVFPIAELWKEKLTNNPGFDFHTESTLPTICFGEAKYDKASNPYTAAASQIIDFIKDKKDLGDAAHLERLATKTALESLLKSSRGFTVAFSLKSDDPEKVLKNALKSDLIATLCKTATELQLVGVQS